MPKGPVVAQWQSARKEMKITKIIQSSLPSPGKNLRKIIMNYFVKLRVEENDQPLQFVILIFFATRSTATSATTARGRRTAATCPPSATRTTSETFLGTFRDFFV